MKTKNKNTKTKTDMSSKNVYEETMYYARWIALYEAINMIAEEAKQRKQTFDELKLSPVKIKKYISSVEDHIQKKLLQEKLGVDFYIKDNNKTEETYYV
jgi:hypothetical protein